MRPAEQALDTVGVSLEEIQCAASLWDAADLTRIADCRGALESVARKMAEAQTLLTQDQGADFAVLRPRLFVLKAEALRIERLVDAAAAFLRGAFPLVDDATRVYGASGAIRLEPAPSRSVQG